MNPVYLGLGVAIAVMLVAIAWLVSTRRVVVSATPAPQRPVLPVLAPSHDQLFMSHVAPVFEDKLNKELTAKQADALYNAYKGVKIEPKS